MKKLVTRDGIIVVVPTRDDHSDRAHEFYENRKVKCDNWINRMEYYSAERAYQIMKNFGAETDKPPKVLKKVTVHDMYLEVDGLIGDNGLSVAYWRLDGLPEDAELDDHNFFVATRKPWVRKTDKYAHVVLANHEMEIGEK